MSILQTSRDPSSLRVLLVRGLAVLALVGMLVPGTLPAEAADTTPPDLSCGMDKSVECGDDWAFDIPTAVDEIDGFNLVIEVVSTVTNAASPRCPVLFSVTRTWRAIDTSGNASFCNQTVTVLDTQPPDLTCGTDKRVECCAAWAFDIPTAVDQCDLNNVLIQVVSTVTNTANPRCPALFSVTRTWRATDTCGNSSFCNQTVTVVDTEPPDLSCGPDKCVECGAAWAFDNPTAVDKCDLNNVLIEVVSTVTNAITPRCPALFSVTRTWRATDTCGNSSFCNQTITVLDTIPPVITCVPALDVQCLADVPPCATSVAAFLAAGGIATDNCDADLTYTCVDGPLIPGPTEGTIRRTHTVTDDCNNSASCVQVITIKDTTPPTITCPANIVVNIPGTVCEGVATYAATATDNCVGVPVVVCAPPSGSTFPAGTTAVTCTATDVAGNTGSCSFTVSVHEPVPPMVSCVDDITVDCGSDTSPAATGTATAMDNCPGATVSYTDQVAIEIEPASLGNWALATQNTGAASFVEGPGTPPLLTGSLHLSVGTDGTGIGEGRNSAFHNTPLSALTELNYWAYRTASPGGSNHVMVVLNIDTDGDGVDDDVIFFEPRYQRPATGNASLPDQGPIVNNTWQRWNALKGGWHSRNHPGVASPGTGVQPLSVYLAAYPTARIVNNAGGGGVHLAAGSGLGNWQNFDANADAFTIGVSGTSRTYNFERIPGLDCTVTKIKEVIIRVWTATDASGNQNSCSQIIQLRDSTAPMVAAGSIASCYLTVADAEAAAIAATTAVDACPGPVVLTAVTVGDCAAVITVTATDGCGNSASVSYNTRLDNQAPTLTTAAGSLDATLECNDLTGILDALVLAPAATDNCDTSPTLHLVGDDVTPGPCPAAYVRVRRWNFTDTCGNTSADFVQTITVRDTTLPLLGACPANITVACTHGGGEVVNFTEPAATDNCDAAPLVTCTPASGSTFGAGVTTVTCSASDACGNASVACSFTVSVIDTVRPTIVCPPDALVQCPDPTDPSATGTATSTDNCDLTPVITSADETPLEVTPSTPLDWNLRTTATGVAGYVEGPGTPPLPSGSVRLAVGNDSGSLAEARLSGFDGTKLADLTELAYSSYRATVPVGGVNEDILLILEIDTDGDGICDDLLVFEPEWQGTPVLNATWQRWNAHSGKWWSQNNPAIGGTRGAAGVKPLSAYLAGFPDAKICGAGGLSGVALRAGLVFGAWRNFDGNADFVCIRTATTGGCYNFEATAGNQCPTLNIIVRAWTATDSSGNQITCSQAIVVTDTVAPVIAGCTDLGVDNDVGQCSAIVNFAPTADDACSGPAAVTCSPASGTEFPVGSTAVTCTATDNCNNTGTCTFTVIVRDAEQPVVSCPAPITVGNDPDRCGALVTFVADATDNCPGVAVVCVPASGTFFPIGSTPVDCTATDAAGNLATCSFAVTVNDTQPPVAACPADITVGNDAGACSALVNYNALATDNCPGVTLACTPASGSTFPVGPTAVTCTAVDAAGNTAACTFLVTVNDTEAPVPTCPASITLVNDPGACSAVATFTASATDNCPGASIDCLPASGTAFPAGVTTVVCTATDAAGNLAACSFTVTVNDTEPPVAKCPTDITVGNDPGQCSAVVTFVADATDNCTGTTVVCVPAGGSTFPLGTTPVTCTATDAAGNTATCNFTVTVKDTQAPVVACPADITVANDAGQCSAVVNYTASASDNCDSAIQVSIYSGFGTTGGGAPYSGLVGTFAATGVSFATDTGYLWHPFGLTDFGADITGTLVVAADDTYTFSLDSDDGSVLLIDGALVVDDGGTHAPGGSSGSVLLTAGTHTFEVQFFECCGDPSGVDLTLPTGVTYATGSPAVVCAPASGSIFPVGTTTVTCTATDTAGLTGTCSFSVTVNDTEPPVISAVTATQGVDVKDCAATVVQGVVAISVTATDQCPLAAPTVELVNGANTETATFVDESPAGTFNYAWTVTPATASGTWTATVTATDAGGGSDTASFTLCVNPCQIAGMVQLESFNGTGTIPLASHRVVTFKATDVGGVVLKTWTLDLTFTVGTAASGGVASFTLTDVPAGTLNVSAKTDWNKRRKLAVAFDPNCQGVVNFTGATQLKGGDISGDNTVNLADYSALVSHWLELVSAVPAAAVADMNGDDAVNFLDYVILGTNWFTVGDPE